MPPPSQVLDWLKRTYPKPTVDPEWLDACYAWIESEFNFDASRDLQEILHHLEVQLLQSDLTTSMLPGTGLPMNVSDLSNTTIRGPPILVEIISMTEIGSSAFNLQNVRQARIEHADLAGLVEDGEEEGSSVPKYPRSMLRFQLSDGSTTLQAIEYRRLPDLELGETPLGFKMVLKNVLIRRGIAFLEPSNVELKYHQTEERQATADEDFVRGLQLRMGKPPNQNVPATAQRSIQNAPPPAREPTPRQTQHAAQRPSTVVAVACPRSPPGLSNPSEFDVTKAEQPHRGGPSSAARASAFPSVKGPELIHSKYFAPPTDSEGERSVVEKSSKGKEKQTDLSRVLGLSPHRTSPFFMPDSDEDIPGVLMDVDGAGDGSSDNEYWGSFDDSALLEAMYKTEGETFGDRSVASFPAAARSTLAEPSTTEESSSGLNGSSSGKRPQPIYISDSDDKENAPVKKRKVRRRIEVVADEDIIEISE